MLLKQDKSSVLKSLIWLSKQVKIFSKYSIKILDFYRRKIRKEVIIWLSKSKHKQNTSKPLLLLLCIRKNKIITADNLLYRS